MRVTITFNLDDSWDSYKDTDYELLVEDMFDNWEGKDGISIDNIKICD